MLTLVEINRVNEMTNKLWTVTKGIIIASVVWQFAAVMMLISTIGVVLVR